MQLLHVEDSWSRAYATVMQDTIDLMNRAGQSYNFCHEGRDGRCFMADNVFMSQSDGGTATSVAAVLEQVKTGATSGLQSHLILVLVLTPEDLDVILEIAAANGMLSPQCAHHILVPASAADARPVSRARPTSAFACVPPALSLLQSLSW